MYTRVCWLCDSELRNTLCFYSKKISAPANVLDGRLTFTIHACTHMSILQALYWTIYGKNFPHTHMTWSTICLFTQRVMMRIVVDQTSSFRHSEMFPIWPMCACLNEVALISTMLSIHGGPTTILVIRKPVPGYVELRVPARSRMELDVVRFYILLCYRKSMCLTSVLRPASD